MESAPQKFIKIVSQIATTYGMDLSEEFNHLRLEQQNYLPLVIEKLGTEIISVAHYQEINGDLVGDPDISFKIYHLPENQQSWIPLEIRQVMGRQTVSYLENEEIVRFNQKGQKEIASFCSMWADNLKSQGWHIKEKPNPEITATSSYFEPLTA